MLYNAYIDFGIHLTQFINRCRYHERNESLTNRREPSGHRLSAGSSVILPDHRRRSLKEIDGSVLPTPPRWRELNKC